MTLLTIGRLAMRTGLSAETIRYYERLELLPAPQRLASGYRVYTPEDARRLVFIRRAKDLGFTLGEIRELLNLSEDDTVDCGAIRARAQAKLDEIDGRLADLARMREGLAELASYCPGAGRPLAECSVLAHFFSAEVAAPEPSPTSVVAKEAAGHEAGREATGTKGDG